MSPNETGPPRETGKQRTGRIRLDYYKTLDPLSRGKDHRFYNFPRS